MGAGFLGRNLSDRLFRDEEVYCAGNLFAVHLPVVNPRLFQDNQPVSNKTK
jgi:hypothetical protein